MSFTRKFSKRDLIFCLVTGLIDGLVIWRIFAYVGVPEIHGIPWGALALALPVLWILGVLLGYLLGQWLEFFDQFGRFAVIGFTNAGVDFGVFNIMLAATGYTQGFGYSFIKTGSFIVALICSYILNKFWTFGGASGGRAEFGKFIAVTVLSFCINVGVSSLVATYIHPLFGMNAIQWANASNIVGVAIGLVFNFVGFKFAVFKK
jgi:putative flippase GtrA